MKFAVIGHPVAHSLSPVMHAANFAVLGIDATYDKIDIPPGELASRLKQLVAEGYNGLNVTVPYKEAVIDCLDELDSSVEKYGACNTIKIRPDGKTIGFNTDVAGYLYALESNGFSLLGQRVLILGCGGAGRAIAFASLYAGAREIVVCSRRLERAMAAVAALEAKKGAATAMLRADVIEDVVSSPDEVAAFDLVVNATPVGLDASHESLIPSSSFKASQFVFDIIPTKHIPPMTQAARSAGAQALDGLQFLAAQGAKAWTIWTGLPADLQSMQHALADARR